MKTNHFAGCRQVPALGFRSISRAFTHRRVWPIWLAVLTLGTALPVSAAVLESNLAKVFTVKPGGELFMDVDRGSIEITTGDRADVSVEVKRRVTRGSLAHAQEVFARHEVTFDQDGDHVSVQARFKDDSGHWLSGGQNLEVEYHIAAPKQFNFDLRTAAGDVSLTDVEGSLKARTSGGGLRFSNVQGPVEAMTSAGDIHLLGATGSVKVKTSGGAIEIGRLDADASVETSAGPIRVKTAKAKLNAKTSGGEIELSELGGPAEVVTSAGSIRVKVAQARLDAKTSGGEINIDDARDTVVAHSSAGAVRVLFSAQPHEDCRLTTSGGEIRVKLAKGLAFDLDAKTSGGQVSTEVPVAAVVSGRQRNDELKGTINGGGKALSLKTSAGDISLLNP